MKNIDGFEREETAEEWLREGYKVVATRRNIMFRNLIESIRFLLFGNAGGAGLVIGFMGGGASGSEGVFHWLALSTVLLFGIGTITSALTMFLVTFVSIKEAHGSEDALKKFTDGVGDRSEVMFNIEARTWHAADLATLAGIVSVSAFVLGGTASLALLVIFF